jgi:sensor histidine kinase YesM
MGFFKLTEKEKEWAQKASRFIKVETKRAGIGYKELAERLNKHGLEETEASITSKLGRGTFSATFLLAAMAVIGLSAISLEDL